MQFQPSREAGLERLNDFLPRAGRAYANNRNYDDGPGPDGVRRNVSQLSPWLHAGILSEREVVEAVLGSHSPSASEKFIAEVFWRIYFKGYLEQRPSIWRDFVSCRDAALARLEQNSGLRKAYDEAIEGTTGIEAFDHWTRELIETGYLHNHARMWFASIWIFTLKLDWQLGADFFLRHLIDADAASNTLSWRWVGGLHTKGKTYLARASNIARYTANQPSGALSAKGLAGDAPALTEAIEHSRQPLELPNALPNVWFDEPYALLLHDDGASHAPLDLPRAPALIIGAARSEARSKMETGSPAREFAKQAIEKGTAAAADHFDCPRVMWEDGDNLSQILGDAELSKIVLPFLPQGWTKDALAPALTDQLERGDAVELLGELNRSTFPHAKAGFFGVKKKIEPILRELGISGAANSNDVASDQLVMPFPSNTA